MYELDEGLAALFMEATLDYDGFCHAIKLAKERGMNDEDCKSLIDAKSEVKKKIDEYNKKILKLLPSDENIARIEDNWFGVRYVNEKGESQLKNDPLIEKEIYIVSMGDERKRDLTRTDIDRLLPIIKDEQAVEARKEKVHFRACELLFELMGIEIIPNDDGVNIVVSAHAMERWGQRKLGLSKSQSVEYKRNNYQSLQNDIVAIFRTAELVWEDEENYQYYLDDENVAYVFKDNVIVTLYEKDYGFTKEINRMITIEQLKVLGETWRKYQTLQGEYETEINIIEDQDVALAAQIRSLQAQMDFIKTQRQVLLDRKAEKSAQLTAEYQSYQAEFAKLFKKWETKETA